MAVKSLARSGLITFDKYSSMLAGNAAFDPSSDWLLEEQVLTSAAASVTFSNLSQYASEYQHLQIRFTAKSTRAGDQSDLNWYANGNTTTSSYAGHLLYGNGSSVTSMNILNDISLGFISGSLPASNRANQFQAGIIDILDPFETTKNKTVKFLRGSASSWYLGGGDIGLGSGVFLSTAALSSFTIRDRIANLDVGSRFSLYGVK